MNASICIQIFSRCYFLVLKIPTNIEAGTNQEWELHKVPWMCDWSSSVGPRGDVCSTIWELSLPHVLAQLLSCLREISSYLYVQVWLIISVTLYIYIHGIVFHVKMLVFPKRCDLELRLFILCMDRDLDGT